MGRLRTMGIGIALIVALGVGVFMLGGSERAEAQSGQRIPGTLTVTGSAAISAPPDGASIEIRVSSLEATATEALSAGATALELVRAALAEEGVADEDLQTVRISLDEESITPRRAASASASPSATPSASRSTGWTGSAT